MTALTAFEWFVLAHRELMLFVGIFFLLGALDEFSQDIVYLWLRLTWRARTPRIDRGKLENRALTGRCAVFIPAWQEHRVIAATIRHALTVWPQDDLRLYVGCYRNDSATLAATMQGSADDRRLRIVIHDVDGPSCKADCLNRLFRALHEDEVREGSCARMVVLHDAEDMVDAAALPLLDAAMDHAEFVQLPVLALPHPGSPLVSGHYSDEFAESHAKTMVVRSALGQGIPGAGVGCAIDRDWLTRLDGLHGGAGPFATGALTEDYELGLKVAALGARTRFLRVRTDSGRLVATRAYFPSSMSTAIRQKTRWVHGIALQGWDRLGWQGSPVAIWMQMRDRRGPLAALLLALAYVLIVMSGIELALTWLGVVSRVPLSRGLELLLWCNLLALGWRVLMRFVFTTREFGWWQGLLSVPRIIVSNTVASVAARRALAGYWNALRGGRVLWDKTEHGSHPALGSVTVFTGDSR